MRWLRGSVCVLALVSACSVGQSVVGGRGDGGDVPDVVDVAALDDAPDVIDVVDVVDAPDVVDVEDVVDAPDAVDAVDVPDVVDVVDAPDVVDVVDAPDVMTGCRSDADCAGNPDGPACNVATARCVACVTDAHCGPGLLCAGDRCVSGCSSAHACPAGQTCCTGACVDTQSTVAHCGGCDVRCAPPRAATAACMNGQCAVVACEASFGDCDGSPANGCETDTRSSLDHCGGCRMACTAGRNAIPACAGATCQSSCAAGFADCDGSATNGCEVDTRVTVAHCGGCGRLCAPPNATASCAAGACGVGACATGFADCNRNATDGCETDTRTSVSSCGGCGVACPAGPNAIPACVGGACRVSCAAGFADCDGDASNGCEVDTRTSVAHCGGCGQACVAAGGAVACAMGVCGVTRCDAGRADCNGNGRDGCEVTVTTDASNCGACGVACPTVDGRRVCSAGSCNPTGCRAVRDANTAAVDGRYQLDLDGAGVGPARTYYCDMRNGGWTVVANQVPSELLADTTATINEAQFGQIDHSWRLGNPEITRVRPGVAWRLNDEATDVYVAPGCVVDWTQDYIRVLTQDICTTGYTTPSLTTLVNGRWTHCSARGIGVNNNGASCSIRMNESGFGLGVGALPNGRAYTCDYNTTRRVSLSFQ